MTTTGLTEALRYSTAMAVAVSVYGGVLLLVARFTLFHVFGSAFVPAATLGSADVCCVYARRGQ